VSAAVQPLLVPVHKALRRFMFDTVVSIGALDVTDADDVAATSDQTDRLLQLLREPDAALRALPAQLRDAPVADRTALATQIYRALSRRVGERLQAMADDETHADEMLWCQHTDEQRAELRRGSLGTLDVAELREALAWMCDALSPQELASLLEDLHASATTATFRVALEVVSSRLDERRWNRVARALGIAQVTVSAPRPQPLSA
jgi:hypothetical protein